MTRYVITIAPDATGKPDAAVAQTTVRVDTSTGDARITELTVRAPSGGGIAPGDLPAFDLDLLIRAVAAPSTIRALPAAERHTGGSGPEPSEMDEPVAAARPAATGETAVADTGPAGEEEPAEVAGAEAVEVGESTPEPAGPGRAGATVRKATAKKAAAKKAGARKAAAKKAPAARKTASARKAAKATGRKATGAAAAAAKVPGQKAAGTKAAGGRAAKAAKATGERDGVRAYRRMPDPAEVLAAYAQSGSITGLAQHYGVPRHTANGWARRLRQQGHTIGRK